MFRIYKELRAITKRRHLITRNLIIFTLLLPTLLFGQTRISYKKQIQDSICKYGKKYDKPERININFPEKKVSDDYKIKELHRAIPDSLDNEESPNWWYYNYYFGKDLLDYDPIGDSTFTPTQDKLLYKLKDTYFFDMNGDGLLDFIHYPKYYRALMIDSDSYEIFIQQRNGYKWIKFKGFIIDVAFNKDKTINKMTTFQGFCCDDNQATFYYYTFDKTTNELTLTRTEQILNCQLKNK